MKGHATRAALVPMVLAMLAAPASAQVTGTVTGSVKDAQGGVVPGATIALVSATRATRTETVTNAEGDYVFPNVTAGTYTVRVSMDGFKTVERPDIIVSPGDRIQIPALTIAIGALTETVTVLAESPIIQASTGERSFTVKTESVANLPLSDRNFATLASLAPGVDGTARIGGGGATNFMMDGVGTMDTGSNRLLMAVNVESIAEVKVLTSELPGRVRPVERAADHGRHQERHEPLPRIGLRRGKELDWNKNSKTNILNGDPKAISKSKDWGYSIGGPIGKPGGSNKLFFFYAHEYQPRTSGNNVVRFRMPTALERAGDFSQTTDNNGNPYSLIRDASTNLPCTAADTRGCFQDGGVARPDSGESAVSNRPEHPEDVPDAQHGVRPGRPLQLRAHQADAKASSAISRRSASTTSRRRNCGGPSSTRRGRSGNRPSTGHPRVQRLADAESRRQHHRGDGQLQPEPDDVPRGDVGARGNEQAGCALTGTPQFCTGALPMNPNSNRIDAGLGGLPYLFPDATILNPDYYAYGVMNSVSRRLWDGTRLQMAPGFTWGGRVANPNPPPEPAVRGLPERQPNVGHRRSA